MKWTFEQAILLTVSLLLAISSCSNQENNSENKAGAALKAATAKIDLEQLFKQSPSGLLDSMDLLCAKSKSYQADAWEELNHCRWALEKKELAKIPEYAKRKDDILSLQIDDGQWMALSHERTPKEQAKYFQFRKYAPQSHSFIITQHFANACPMQWFVDGKNGQRLFFPGTIWAHPNRPVYITGTNGQLDCPSEIYLIHFDRAGKIQSKQLTFKQQLQEVKWTTAEALFQLKDEQGKTEYRKWVLP